MKLKDLKATQLDGTVKGFPDVGDRRVTLADIGSMGWSVLNGTIPIPVATIDLAQLRANSRWMQRFTSRHGVKLCPHGKTTMAPQLFKLQLDDGAWGITVASTQQLLVCRRFGVNRVLLANQLVGRQEATSIFRILNEDPNFDLYCLVDSIENAKWLQHMAVECSLIRPLKVLLEGGVVGGRAGCRNVDEAMTIARTITKSCADLALCGIEGFEGVIDYPECERTEVGVHEFIEYLAVLVERSLDEDLFGATKPILSVGGSLYFDMVVTHPHVRRLSELCQIVLRSGCYLTHDSQMMSDNFQRMCARTPGLADLGPSPRPALTVWGQIQSIPERRLAIVNIGKRDVSYDVDLPVAERWYRSAIHTTPVKILDGVNVVSINDQHLYLQIPPVSAWQVGDIIGFGISHPCTTFDKWRLLYVVNERLNIVDGILTFF